MLSSYALFLSIAKKFEQNFKDINKGSLLSNPAIEYRGRAFAYYKDDCMIIKLSDNSSLEHLGIKAFRPAQLLNRSHQHWYEIPSYYKMDWEQLGEAELRKLSGLSA